MVPVLAANSVVDIEAFTISGAVYVVLTSSTVDVYTWTGALAWLQTLPSSTPHVRKTVCLCVLIFPLAFRTPSS